MGLPGGRPRRGGAASSSLSSLSSGTTSVSASSSSPPLPPSPPSLPRSPEPGSSDSVASRSGVALRFGAFDALEAGGGVDLHDLGAVLTFEHVDAGHAQAQNVGGAYGGGLVFRRE